MSAVEAVVPELDSETYGALKDSIGAYGVLVPILKRRDGTVIDGRHRLRIADELGLTNVPERVVDLDVDDDVLNVTVNLVRRHLHPAKRAAMAEDLRRRGRSLRAIAGALGVSTDTVRNDLTDSGVRDLTPELPQVTQGEDGKKYPLRKIDRATKAQALDDIAAGVPQKDIADRLGVSRGTVSHWVKTSQRDTSSPIPLPAATDKLPSRVRVEQIRPLAAAGHRAESIAKQLRIGEQHVRNLARLHGIRLPAEEATGGRHRLKSQRIVEQTVHHVAGIGVLFDQIDYTALDPDEMKGWVISLSDAIRSLTTLRNNLKKEMTQ